MAKRLLLIGDNIKVKEFASVLQSSANVALASDVKTGLAIAREIVPDGIVFIVPVYWENILPFLEEIKKDDLLKNKPIVYVGDFIEASDQTILKGKGVHTITLGPVPIQEIGRYILSLT